MLERSFTPNSHDLFRASIQADKVTVQLASNAQDPKIQALMVEELNKLQSEVNECHTSDEGQALRKKISEFKALKELQKVQVTVQDQGHRYNLRERAEKKPSTYDDECGKRASPSFFLSVSFAFFPLYSLRFVVFMLMSTSRNLWRGYRGRHRLYL